MHHFGLRLKVLLKHLHGPLPAVPAPSRCRLAVELVTPVQEALKLCWMAPLDVGLDELCLDDVKSQYVCNCRLHTRGYHVLQAYPPYNLDMTILPCPLVVTYKSLDHEYVDDLFSSSGHGIRDRYTLMVRRVLRLDLTRRRLLRGSYFEC